MEDVVYYCDHLASPDVDPPLNQCEYSSYNDVRTWHQNTRDKLARMPTQKPPRVGQDTDKTLAIYEDHLYPALTTYRLTHIVEDNASPHNSKRIRQKHTEKGVTLVGYEATDTEKEEIVRLVTHQTRAYRREQDHRAQIIKQTKELDRLPV